MTQRHKHADLIIACANGAQIQYKSQISGEWKNTDEPIWIPYYEYRIKPEPKPDVVRHANLYRDGVGCFYDSKQQATDAKHTCLTSLGMLKFTFDGETGSIKSVEVLK